MRYLLILITFLYLTSPSTVYSAQNRVALVIGNGAYRSAPLRNPVNDARHMRKLLSKADFSATIVENASKSELVNAIINGKDINKVNGLVKKIGYKKYIINVR